MFNLETELHYTIWTDFKFLTRFFCETFIKNKVYTQCVIPNFILIFCIYYVMFGFIIQYKIWNRQSYY